MIDEIDEELVRFHDAELPPEEMRRVRESLKTDPDRMAALRDIQRIDRALLALDEMMQPTPEQIEAGKAALLAKLRKMQEPPRYRRWHRWPFFTVAFATAAAAVIIITLTRAHPEIGTIRYGQDGALESGARVATFRPDSSIRTSPGESAFIELAGIAKMSLGANSTLKVGEQPSDLSLHHGRLSVESQAGLRIAVGDAGRQILIDPGSALKVLVTRDAVRIDQQRGRSRITGGDKEITLEGERDVHLVIPQSDRK
jgi:ferric-dicitrate binding protein FerR (iron transport regulator)